MKPEDQKKGTYELVKGTTNKGKSKVIDKMIKESKDKNNTIIIKRESTTKSNTKTKPEKQ